MKSLAFWISIFPRHPVELDPSPSMQGKINVFCFRLRKYLTHPVIISLWKRQIRLKWSIPTISKMRIRNPFFPDWTEFKIIYRVLWMDDNIPPFPRMKVPKPLANTLLFTLLIFWQIPYPLVTPSQTFTVKIHGAAFPGWNHKRPIPICKMKLNPKTFSHN